MNPTPRTLARLCAAAVLLALVLPAGGCIFGRPNQPNIGLRKKVQELEGQIAELKQQHEADQALIGAYRRAEASSSPSSASRPSLPPGQLEQLFTTHGLKFGRLTGGYDRDRNRPGDDGIKVYVVPTDDAGQPLKAAGSFTIEAFDLRAPQSPLVGTWTFDVAEAKKNWYGAFMDYTYAFTLPWQTVPAHDELTVKVKFVDALTGLPFENQTTAKVKLPTAPPAAAQVSGTDRGPNRGH